MNVFDVAIIAAAVLAAGATPVALVQTPDSQSDYVITYIEVAPTAEVATAILLR